MTPSLRLPGVAALAVACLASSFLSSGAIANENETIPFPVVTESVPDQGSASDAAFQAAPQKVRHDKLPAEAATGAAGTILTQTGSVRIGCFPDDLRAVLKQISVHFGKPVVVTSGHRGGGRRGSFHRSCQAADVQIAGVSPSAIARHARAMPGVGGVGTYGHTRSVHVDVGDRVFSWYGTRRRSASLSGGCCPACAATAAAAQGGRPRFEAVCTG